MAADGLTAGTVLDGTYELIAELGAGGMGVVWRAKHLRLPKEVAVKVLRGVLGSDTDVYARFRREAEIASQLGHPNIVEALDFNVLPDGSPYLVLELLRGQSLRQVVAQGPLPLERALVITSQIAAGLRAAHRREIVHRDLKPENIFLCQQEQEDAVLVKILDFGISKIHTSQSLQTREGVLMGTPHYMAPEQATGGAVDARTDQFALAAMAFEMVTGRGPFFAEQPLQVLYQVVHAEAPKASERRAGLPPAFDAVLQRGLAKERSTRFENVTELAKALWEASGMVAPREAWALLSSTTHDGVAVSSADSSMGSAPTIASEPPHMSGILGTAPTIDSGQVLTGPMQPRPSPTTGPTLPQLAPQTGPPLTATEVGALANAATLAQTRPPAGGWQTGPVAPSPPAAAPAGRGLGLVLVVALLASLGGGAMVWWLTRTPTTTPAVAVRGAADARTAPRPDQRLQRADARAPSLDLLADQSSAKKPIAKKPIAKKPIAKKPIAKKPRPPATPALKLSASLRARLLAAERLLRKKDYRGTILQAERILRDLPQKARWRAHRLLMLGYCGKLELTNARGYYRLLPRGAARRAAPAHCQRLGTPFEP